MNKIFNIFDIAGIASSVGKEDPCAPVNGELLYNYTFDCGLKGWHFDPNFEAVLTDNGNGSIHIDAIDRYGSVVPNRQVFPGAYHTLKIDVLNVVGNGKISIRKENNQWVTLLEFTTDGVHEVEYIGAIRDINCGANDDTSFACDFLSYSLMGYCPLEGSELLYNHSFKCGLLSWGHDPAYNAELTDNGDGSIHLKTLSNYGSVVPDYDVFPVATYVLEIEVINVVGNGKMSIRNSANTWFNMLYFTTDGKYFVEYTGSIKDIHCGASNDSSFECDFLSYSLKKKV